jgi:hypothetical protein
MGQTFNRDISPELAEIWCRALADLSAERFDRACTAYLRAGVFFPTPAAILKLSGVTADQESVEDAQAEAAWKRVLDFCDRWHVDVGLLTGCPALSETRRLPSVRLADRALCKRNSAASLSSF